MESITRNEAPPWYPEWTRYAACARYSLAETDYAFFDYHQDKGIQAWAKGVCATCPVIVNCLKYGMAIPYGIFGGKTAMERMRMRGLKGRPGNFNASWYSAPCSHPSKN